MKRLLVMSCTLLCALSLWSQIDSTAIKYANTITSDELKEHLYELADDKYEGRETGLQGQKLAAKYISSYFKSLGIPPAIGNSYFQPFPLKKSSNAESKMMIGGSDYKFVDDFYFFSGFDKSDIDVDQLLYVGYGIESELYNDYKGLDVKDKVLLMEMGEPSNSAGMYHVTGSKDPSEWSGDFRMKRELAQTKGAKAVIMINPNYDVYVSRIKYYLENPTIRLDDENEGNVNQPIPCYFVGRKSSNQWFGGKKKYNKRLNKMNNKGSSKRKLIKTRCIIQTKKLEEQIKSENVLAFIEGSDPELKDEVVVVTAHYDHVGVTGDDVYNGADDDGSGTVTALELAEAFMQAKKDGNGTRRSVLVMTVSGEEKGLLGSAYYADHPVYPLEKTVVDLNIDMIGRVDTAHYNNTNYVYLIGSDRLSTELHEVSENVNATYSNLELDYTYNDPKDPNRFYYRSDHYNFAKNNIPVIFYFSGVHEDYHQPTDTPDKIMYGKMEKIAKLVFHTAWEIANRDDKLKVDVDQD